CRVVIESQYPFAIRAETGTEDFRERIALDYGFGQLDRDAALARPRVPDHRRIGGACYDLASILAKRGCLDLLRTPGEDPALMRSGHVPDSGDPCPVGGKAGRHNASAVGAEGGAVYRHVARGENRYLPTARRVVYPGVAVLARGSNGPTV